MSLHEKELGLLGKEVDSRAGRGKNEINLEHPPVPGNMEVLRE